MIKSKSWHEISVAVIVFGLDLLTKTAKEATLRGLSVAERKRKVDYLQCTELK
jgi:hypothetical protein